LSSDILTLGSLPKYTERIFSILIFFLHNQLKIKKSLKLDFEPSFYDHSFKNISELTKKESREDTQNHVIEVIFGGRSMDEVQKQGYRRVRADPEHNHEQGSKKHSQSLQQTKIRETESDELIGQVQKKGTDCPTLAFLSSQTSLPTVTSASSQVDVLHPPLVIDKGAEKPTYHADDKRA
jgi:hypothetical protein